MHIYIYIYIFIIIMLSYWLSLAIHPYHPPLPAGLLDYILCPYRAVVDKFFLVNQLWPVCMKWPIGECHLWIPLYFSSSVTHELFVFFGWFERWKVDSCSLCFFMACRYQDLFNITLSILMQFPSSFLFILSVSVHVVHPYSRIDTMLLRRNCVLFYRIGQTSIWSIAYW